MWLTSGFFTRPSWKEQVRGSWVQSCLYLHQWHWYGLLTHDKHLEWSREGVVLWVNVEQQQIHQSKDAWWPITYPFFMITNRLLSIVGQTNHNEGKTRNTLTTCVHCSCRKRSWCWQRPGPSPWTLDRVVQSDGLLQNIVATKGLVIYWKLFHFRNPPHKNHNFGCIWCMVSSTVQFYQFLSSLPSIQMFPWWED